MWEAMQPLVFPALMMWAGQALHLLKKLRELEVAGSIISPLQFFRQHPYSVLFSVVAGMVAFGMLYATQQLNPIGAFTAGYMADSVVNAFTTKSLRKIDEA